MMSTPSIHHSQLSTTFLGLRHSISSETQVWQFRGIKYGTVPCRFKQSIIYSAFPEIYDATSYGPKCPQAKVPLRMEDALIGLPPGLASHAEDIYDEFNCLHLNITVPAKPHVESDLPVMVYVHGGGGRSGSNSDWWCDGGSVVKQSIEMGKPVVHVAVNYRLAVLGYLGSTELRKGNGNVDGGNYGHLDVHTALEWIHQHITPFGGNPNNITLYGESAGSHAVNAQIHSLLPAHFVRCISQSLTMGVPLLSTPQTIAEKDTVYNAMKTHLKLSTVKEMEVVPWEELLAAYEICDPKHTFGEQAMIDGEFIDDNWTERFSFLGDGSGEVIVGNTGAEGAVCTVVLSVLPATEPKPSSELIVGALSSVAPTEKISSILQAYNITSTTPQEHIAAALLAIAEDIGWYKAASDFAIQLRKNGTKVFEYSFEQLQPFTGPFKGIAGHSLDLAYLHGNPGIFSLCPEPAREIAIQDAIQRSWITFANGGEPWDGKKTRLFGPGGKVADVSREEVLRGIRRGKAWESLDTLTGNELLGLTGIAVGFCGQLIGTG